jgi:hypothetical protein
MFDSWVVGGRRAIVDSFVFSAGSIIPYRQRNSSRRIFVVVEYGIVGISLNYFYSLLIRPTCYITI